MEEQILIHIYIDVEIIFPRYLEPFTQMFTNCYKCFANLSQLQRHESNHIKEKRHFKCNTCNTGFKRADHLKVHELTHKSFKPFQCETCNKSFNRNDTLTRHQKTVHIQQ